VAKGYAAFKTKNRLQYCSKDILNNHDAVADWMSAAVTTEGLRANDILGKAQWPLKDQPRGAKIV
jgi:hypothetical protein